MLRSLILTVLLCPPIRLSISNTVTEWCFDKSQAADIPAMPVPIIAIFKDFVGLSFCKLDHFVYNLFEFSMRQSFANDLAKWIGAWIQSSLNTEHLKSTSMALMMSISRIGSLPKHWHIRNCCHDVWISLSITPHHQASNAPRLLALEYVFLLSIGAPIAHAPTPCFLSPNTNTE